MQPVNVRRGTLLLLFALILPLTALAAGRNVLLFVTDRQVWWPVATGNPIIKTPISTDWPPKAPALSGAYCTTSSCSASRSRDSDRPDESCQRAVRPRARLPSFRLHAWVQSLPLLLSHAGYRTCRLGKFHVGPEAVYQFDSVNDKGLQGGDRIRPDWPERRGADPRVRRSAVLSVRVHGRPASSGSRLRQRRKASGV